MIQGVPLLLVASARWKRFVSFAKMQQFVGVLPMNEAVHLLGQWWLSLCITVSRNIDAAHSLLQHQ